jgi:hypothetical protein
MEAVPITEEQINIDELKSLADKYKKHQERCKAYHKQHPDKTNEKVKKYYGLDQDKLYYMEWYRKKLKSMGIALPDKVTLLRNERRPTPVEVDLMEPLDADQKPQVHIPPLNHIGLWVV